ncbi:MAG: hypothetical protein ACK5P5_07140 [Pseudobdellovibrionaceae bacterium]
MVKNFSFATTAVLSIFLAGLLFSVSRLNFQTRTEEKKNFIAPSAKIQNFTFGYKDLVTDFLWIRVIQDFDFCSSEIKTANPYKVCVNKSWLFKYLDVITILSPSFRMPYATGALALTVLITDIEGASVIFDRGTLEFPTDWPILYRAAYHAIIEEKNFKKAAHLLIQAQKNGGPDWLVGLAGRMLVKSGELEMAKSLINHLNETGTKDQANVYAERIQKRIQEYTKNQQ